jgi:hypothetical protein
MGGAVVALAVSSISHHSHEYPSTATRSPTVVNIYTLRTIRQVSSLVLSHLI